MFVAANRGEKERDERFAVGGVLAPESVLVPVVVLDGARTDVGDGEEGEGEARQVPREDCVADPLHTLAEVVRARHVLEHPAMRDLVPRAVILPQATKNRVRVPVDPHAHNEDDRAKDESRIVQPGHGTRCARHQMVHSLDVSV